MIDISPVIHEGIDVWPGDTPFRLRKLSTFDGGSLDLGTIESTLHVGAHTDAPLHYHPEGGDVASVPLDAYIGPCEVVDVRPSGPRFGWDDLVQQRVAPRVLFKTGSFPDPDNWTKDFVAPEPALVDRLGQAGCRLIGFDTPSTDPMSSKGLPSHQMLRKHGMMNLEGLVLQHVPAGAYTLVALPLKIAGADASPVRAVLLEPGDL